MSQATAANMPAARRPRSTATATAINHRNLPLLLLQAREHVLANGRV